MPYIEYDGNLVGSGVGRTRPKSATDAPTNNDVVLKTEGRGVENLLLYFTYCPKLTVY